MTFSNQASAALPSPCLVAGPIVVTGTGGYIGRRVLATAKSRGLDVRALARAGADRVAYDLRGPVPPGALDGARAVIHLAWAGLDGSDGGDANIEAVRRLLAAAKAAGTPRFIFVSSQSARPEALNRYGRDKWAAEELCRKAGAIIVRPGLVYGGDFDGVWARMLRLAAASPILPLIGGAAPLQPLHVDDLTDSLLALASGAGEGGIAYNLGAETPITLARFLALAAKAQNRRPPLMVPIPLGLALALCKLSTALPGVPSVAPERVLGLAGLRPLGDGPNLRALGVTPRPLEQSLALSAPRRWRPLLAEAQALMGYVLGARRPSPWALRLYVRALWAKGQTDSLGLPRLLARYPALMVLFDPPSGGGALRSRLETALAVAGATPAGARIFMADKDVGRLGALVRLAGIAVAEGLLLLPRLVLAKIRR